MNKILVALAVTLMSVPLSAQTAQTQTEQSSGMKTSWTAGLFSLTLGDGQGEHITLEDGTLRIPSQVRINLNGKEVDTDSYTVLAELVNFTERAGCTSVFTTTPDKGFVFILRTGTFFPFEETASHAETAMKMLSEDVKGWYPITMTARIDLASVGYKASVIALSACRQNRAAAARK